MPDFERLTDSLRIFAAPDALTREWARGYHAGKKQRAMELEIEKLREKNQNLFNDLMAATGKNDELHKQLKEQEGYDGIAHDFEKMRIALENCRLLAARHRSEDWSRLILGFCADGGAIGSVTR